MTSTDRFIVVSGYFPPIVGGTSTVMANLVRAFDPESFWVIAETPDCLDGTHNATVAPEWRVDRFGAPSSLKRIPYGRRIIRWCRFALIPALTARICRRAREIGAGRIVSVFPSWPFYIAACLAHRRLGIPLYTYHMDALPKPGELPAPDSIASRLFDERILRAATERIVLSDAIAADFQSRFGLGSVTVPHSIDLDRPQSAPMNPALAQRLQAKRSIVHSGVVEGFQRDGLLRIAKTLEAHPELNATLVLCTPTSRAELLDAGFDPGKVEIVSLAPAEVAPLQRFASALVVVLPFTHRSDERTPFPTKTVEYMASGTPILAHVPGDAFLARHIAQHRYALVAASEEELPGAIHRILTDLELRTQLAKNASLAVKDLFSIRSVAPRFADACGIARSVLKVPEK